MIEDESAKECLRDFRYYLDTIIERMERGEKFKPDVINLTRLLRARECLASARTEEHYLSKQDATTELPLQE